MDDATWVIQRFDRQLHDRSTFDCGVGVLNDFLTERASQHEKRDLARVYVLVEKENTQVRGYYSHSSHTVIFNALPEDQQKGLPQMDLPVVLIGRLAIDISAQGQKLGEFLLMDALRRVENIANKIGIRAVEVDAIDDVAKRFYAKYGFLSLEDDPRHLFLPMSVIRKLKLPPILDEGS